MSTSLVWQATKVASPGRFELPASRLGGARSIQLSYGDLLTATFELVATSAPRVAPDGAARAAGAAGATLDPCHDAEDAGVPAARFPAWWGGRGWGCPAT